MKLKEKCIYYNPTQEGYYLVLSISDMIYGRSGDYIKTSTLENWINQNGPGVRFKIGDIIINRNYIRNYNLNEERLEQFELVRELTDEEFYLIEILTFSNYNWPATLIDIDNIKDNKKVFNIIRAHKDKEKELEKLNKEIKILEIDLYTTIK